jgi:hypothetical protein
VNPYFANPPDLHSINPARQARNISGLNRKQQLKVLTAVQRELQRIERSTAA